MSKSNQKPQIAIPHNDPGEMPGGSAGAELLARGRTVSRMQVGQYHTAIQVQQKRELKEVQRSVIEEASLLGEDFLYGWEVNDKSSKTGKSWIEGVSIDGAMIMVRNWGNCAVPVRIEEDAPQHWILEATFVDLQTGYTLTRLFRQRKSQKTMKSDDERGLDIAFQIGQSKAQRNVVVKAMPAWLLNSARDAALSSTCAKYEGDLDGFRKKAVGAFEGLKVTKPMLEKWIGLPAEAWTARDLARLSTLYRSITKDKTITVEQAFAEEPVPPGEPVAAEPQPQSQTTAAPTAVVDDDFGGAGTETT